MTKNVYINFGLSVIIAIFFIATSGSFISGVAIAGYVLIVLAIVALVSNLRHPIDPDYDPALSEQERQRFLTIREHQGPMSAIKQLRSEHPRMGLEEAKDYIQSLGTDPYAVDGDSNKLD